MRRKSTTTEMMKGYIVDSLLLLMRKQPYADITIGEITAKAGVNRSTYYRNFTSKEAIIKYYYNQMLQGFLEQISPAGEMPLKRYLEEIFSYHLHHRDELLLIFDNGIAHLILDALNELFSSRVEGQPIKDRFRAYYHTGGIYNTFLLWFGNRMRINPEKLAAMSTAVLPEGFRPMLLRNSP